MKKEKPATLMRDEPLESNINQIEVQNFVDDWTNEFIERIRTKTKSTKTVFSYHDAVNRSARLRTPFDTALILYRNYISVNTIMDNDYFKYLESFKNGKKLNLKYFRHSKSKLETYYKKVESNEKYNPFNLFSWREYVLFMILKLKGLYKKEYDNMFNVKVTEHREYNPLSKIPSVLRANLPFKVKEFDIVRAFPTFIDRELGISNRDQDVYNIIDKVTFNTLLNIHNDVKGTSIEDVRTKLKPIYGSRVNEVITESRFNEKGRMFKDMVIYEEQAIEKFVEANDIENFVRLHDGIFVLEETKAAKMDFDGLIHFTSKECIRPKIENQTVTFYCYDDQGGLVTSPKQYADFFEQESFMRGREDGNDKLIIFQDTNKVVSPFNYKTETVKYLKSEINELDTTTIENRIARESSTIVSQAYLLLPSQPVEYYTDKALEFGLPFKNGFFKYDSKDQGFKKMKYTDVKGFFAPHRTQQHVLKKGDDLCSEFQLFLTMVSTGKDPSKEDLSDDDKAILNNFCAMFGYLCHTHKNHSFSPAIILSDEGANDLNRNGGRGKTILVNALQHVQPSMLKGGREFDPTYIHNFADLKNDTRIYILDDVPAGFRYDDLYTNIVGSISCQRKGTEAIEIPFNKAPKFVITTNWAVRYDEAEASTNRRFLEYKFTDFFNINNTPKDIFKRTLFDDWDTEEWNRFYNFIYYCVGLYLNNGLQRIAYDKRKDNYRAIFSNDVVLLEFERIFNLVKVNSDGFTVSDFLKLYQDFQNPLKYPKLFTHKNLKTFITTYITQNNLPIIYRKRDKKWIGDFIDEYDVDLGF
ncbi:hypothetical protein N9E81_00360 [Algibacter sp.]|nr:hypothetical protein [Algibacter sp.]